MEETRTLFSTEIPAVVAPESGLFAWDIERNAVFADGALAELFGLDVDEASQGLPIEAYIERVHPQDRPFLSKVISTSIVAEVPQQSTYRVRNAAGIYRSVTAFGRAFRDRSGTPTIYCGIVVPTPSVDRDQYGHH